MVIFCTLPLLLVASAYVQSPPQSPRDKAGKILESALAQTKGRVLIPLCLWEAALMQKPEDRSRIRFSTFPNYANVERRQAYENEVVETMLTGDLFIVVPMVKTLTHPNDITPWPRHEEYNNELCWKEVAFFNPVVNQTASLGPYQRQDVVLQSMKVFVYIGR
jgi:hypothetical protein